MIFLRRLLDLPLSVILMGIGCGAMYLPAAYALALMDFPLARAFFYSGNVLLILTAMVALATSTYRPRDAAQGQLVSVVVAYLLLPILFAVPLHQAVPGLRFTDAWFEMLSSFTTTGSTIFDTPALVARPVHLWRALVGWMGGFFILLVAVSVFAPRGLGGVELLGARISGATNGRAQNVRIAEPSLRMAHFCNVLFPIYAGLTGVMWVGLLIAGDTALIALCHAMGTLSSSGISPVVGLAGTASGVAGEAIVFLVMGFAVTRGLWPGARLLNPSFRILRDPELQLAAGIVAFATVVLLLHHGVWAADQSHLQSVSGIAKAIWGAAFTTLSFLTTTGFQSADWMDGGSPGLVLLGLAMIGGGVATTAGGVKLLRVYALLRHGERELERIVHPHSIGGHGPVARQLRREGAYLAWIFFMVFGLSVAAITAALTLSGLGLEDALVLCIASLTNTGQLAAAVNESAITYSKLGGVPMGILGFAMILGRLEILAVFAVLTPYGWRR